MILKYFGFSSDFKLYFVNGILLFLNLGTLAMERSVNLEPWIGEIVGNKTFLLKPVGYRNN